MLGNSGKGGGLEDDVDVAIVVAVGVEVVLAAPGSPAVEIRISSLTSGYHNMEFSPTEVLVAPPPPPPPPLSHGFGGDGKAISPGVATHHSVIGSRATSRLCVIWLGKEGWSSPSELCGVFGRKFVNKEQNGIYAKDGESIVAGRKEKGLELPRERVVWRREGELGRMMVLSGCRLPRLSAVSRPSMDFTSLVCKQHQFNHCRNIQFRGFLERLQAAMQSNFHNLTKYVRPFSKLRCHPF